VTNEAEMTSNNESQPLIWLLLDDRAGNRSQCIGVGNALGLPNVAKELTYSWAGKLPNGILGASFFGLSKSSKKALTAPWPDLVIAAGRRTAPVARQIKALSKDKTKLVQIMWPGSSGVSEFDLIAVPEHDKIHEKENIISTLGSPHKVTQEVLGLLKQEWHPLFAKSVKPIIAVIVGGSTKNKTFTDTMANELGTQVSDMANRVGGSLLVTTSRRTGNAAKTLIDSLSAPATVYQWGDEGNNPYPAILACADATVVTGDSMSMCSEACSGTGPVYIYAPPALITPKHKRLHDALYRGGYAKPLDGVFEHWQHQPLNSAVKIASAIKKLI
jgi:mitochondrial fission protein ELM1